MGGWGVGGWGGNRIVVGGTKVVAFMPVHRSNKQSRQGMAVPPERFAPTMRRGQGAAMAPHRNPYLAGTVDWQGGLTWEEVDWMVPAVAVSLATVHVVQGQLSAEQRSAVLASAGDSSPRSPSDGKRKKRPAADPAIAASTCAGTAALAEASLPADTLESVGLMRRRLTFTAPPAAQIKQTKQHTHELPYSGTHARPELPRSHSVGLHRWLLGIRKDSKQLAPRGWAQVWGFGAGGGSRLSPAAT